MTKKYTSVNILGTEYKIFYKEWSKFPDFKKLEACGLCDSILKHIFICKMKTNPNFLDVSDEYAEKLTKETLRHEIIHAFLHESGLSESSHTPESGWAVDEEIVDWIAAQYPKMLEVFKKVDAI